MRDSEAIFYRKSHKATFPAKPSSNGLLEIAEAGMKDPVEKQRIMMRDGGWYLHQHPRAN